jgi:NAD(P)-dependent dehydrogenase (short-subunit alcohol dehydrogenase family)
MAEKIILITGGTNGMGKEAALALAKKGFHIVLLGRKEDETRKVQQEIIAKSNNKKVDYLLADLFILDDIRRLAENFKQKYDHLDVLVQNAGATFGKEREVTTDGIEKTIALNFLAPYLLSALLLDVLQKTPGSRIVITASAGHSFMANPNFDDIELKQGYTANRAYGNSKLFLIMLAQELDRKLKENGIAVAVNTLHPGVVINQKMIKDAESRGFFGMKIILPLMKLLMKSPEQGAQTAIYLASSPEVENTSGLYFSNCKPAKVNTKYISPETTKIIWDYAVGKTGTNPF